MILKLSDGFKPWNQLQFDEYETVKMNRVNYLDVACSFDIETSSFYDVHGNKTSIMYIWMFGFDGVVYIGRTWNEFKKLMKVIENYLHEHSCRLICYVHNLGYEFQFMRKHLEWNAVFSIDMRKPIYARTSFGLEFRCSMIQSGGVALSKIANDLRLFTVPKLDTLDYELIRHSKTTMTQAEIDYCCNDVKILMAYEYETALNDGGLNKIPLTKTSYVRRYTRNHCLKEEHPKLFYNYKNLMRALTLTVEELEMWQRAFMGGFTHSNPHHTNVVMYDVHSDDESSAYPYALVSEPRYPMGKGVKTKINNRQEFDIAISNFCCVFDVGFVGLKPKVDFEYYISLSKCFYSNNIVTANGRVVSGDIRTTITEIDFEIIEQVYTWDTLEVGLMYKYKRGYLPTPFIESVLTLYRDKTTLKDQPEYEVDYMLKKGMLNSCYGMAVTSITRPDYQYTGEWGCEFPDMNEAIAKYNKDFGRFLFYPWGVMCTAISRRNLWLGIMELKQDYIYSDTDSLKYINRANHIDWFNRYNARVKSKLEMACQYHDLSFDMVEPTDIHGVKHLLGVWDYEGNYTKFKTLGAKRYMIEKDGKLNITVSGLNKKVCVPYLQNEYGKKVFEAFTDELYIPPEFTGKHTHTYIDNVMSGSVTDYQGNTIKYRELSGIHLEASDYSLSIAHSYKQFLESIREK